MTPFERCDDAIEATVTVCNRAGRVFTELIEWDNEVMLASDQHCLSHEMMVRHATKVKRAGEAMTDLSNALTETQSALGEVAAWIETRNRSADKLLELLINLYAPAKVAVNQIVCLGGDEPCQPCQNRERLAVALDAVDNLLKEINAPNQ